MSSRTDLNDQHPAVGAWSLGNIRIGKRLAISFGLVLALLVLALAAGIRGLGTMYGEASHAVKQDVALAAAATQIGQLAASQRRYEKDMFINVDSPDKVAAYRERWEKAHAELKQEVKDIHALELDPEATALVDKIVVAHDAYGAGVLQVAERLGVSLQTTHAANLALEQVKDQVRSIDELTIGLRDHAEAKIAALEGMLRSTRRSAAIVLLVIGGLSLSLGILLCVLITRSITRPLGSATGIARSIAAGRFDNPITIASRDETGELLGSLAQMQDLLQEADLNAKGQLAAIGRIQAVAEFTPEGACLVANENFAQVFGYAAEELKGKHHDALLPAVDRNSAEYQRFRAALARGEAQMGQYRRTTRDGREIWMQSVYAPILGADGKPFKVVQFGTDITAQRREAAMNAAFKGALEKLSASVVVADSNFQVIYVNEAGRSLMQDAQAEFRRDLPGFDASRLVGSSIDQLHPNPAQQRSLLAQLNGTHASEEMIGGRTLRLVASPMKDDTGTRLGTVVEWLDRTVELGTEREVQAIIDAVNDGVLDQRIGLEGKSGAFLNLSRGINSLADTLAMAAGNVGELVQAANTGDLTRRIELAGKPRLLTHIGSGINELVGNMARLVAQVKAAAGEVNRGADEISQGNSNLSQRTEEQASSLEETASSMEQMTGTVKQNADNAGQANQLAMAARDQAEKGGAVVSRAVVAMTGINEASRKIADIIGVIDEIAFQTNLLALNAAVEAARAGEQGRGFAVVASEVRSLAGRSATAAKQIKTLIQDSVQKVDEGSGLVTQSGATLEEIVTSVKKVADIVAEITAASHEQSAGIEQVNKAVVQLDEMTQQNAALVEQASAASQSMAEQARALNGLMARYRVDDSLRVEAAEVTRKPASPEAGRPERRKAGRPWSGVSPSAPRVPARTAVESGNTDTAWREF